MPHLFTPDYYPAGILCPGGNCENGAMVHWCWISDLYPGVYPVADGRMQTPDYQWNTSRGAYRWGFNSMEKDDELKGSGNSYDFGARIYDPRVGRWLAVDPLAGIFAAWSPYASFNDNPIIFTDPTGKGGEYTVSGSKITVTVKVYLYTDVYDQAHLENMAAMYNDYNTTAFKFNESTNNNPPYQTEYGDKTYSVEFKVEFEYMSYEDARKGVASDDQSKNYFYVALPESGATAFVAGNCGVLLGDSPPEVAFEEAIHTLDPRYSDDEQNNAVGSHNMKDNFSLMWGGRRREQHSSPFLTRHDVKQIFAYSTLNNIASTGHKTIGTGTSKYLFSNTNLMNLRELLLIQGRGVGIFPNHGKIEERVTEDIKKEANTIVEDE